MNNNLIEKNFLYFKKNLLGRFFVFTIGNKKLIVEVKRKHLKHLIGVGHTTLGNYYSMPGEVFYSMLNKHKMGAGLFDYISKDKYLSNELNEDESFFVEKNYNFIPLFERLINENNHKLYLYKAKEGSLFDADYLYLSDNTHFNKYIGIIGNDNNFNFRFNSIYLDRKNNISGTIREVTNFEILNLEEINKISNKHIIPSPRNKKQKSSSIKIEKKKTNSFKLSNDYKKVNKLLKNNFNSNFELRRSDQGKSSFDLYDFSNTVIKKHIQNELNFDSAEQIAKFIFNRYK